MRINGNDYKIPEVGFGTVRQLENCGISFFDIANHPEKKFMSILNAFVCITVGIEPEQADALMEQHLLGGGTFDGWMQEINEAVAKSGFFQAMTKKSKKNAPKSVTEPTDNQ